MPGPRPVASRRVARAALALTAATGERVRAEPFDAIDLQVGVLFGDEDDDE